MNYLTQRALTNLSLASQAAGLFAFGLMTGFFWTYSINVNLAMLEMDGAVYATVQSAFNRNVRHPMFFAFFFGPMPLALAALLGSWSQRRRLWWWLLALAGVAYALGIVWFTHSVNLPLNHLTESWAPNALPANWTDIRDAWNHANNLRAITSSAIFVLATLAFALRLHTRQPGSTA